MLSLPSRSSKAFTMLELIVVIVILGVLAAIAIPTFARVIERSKRSSLDTTLRAVDRDARALAAFDSRTVTETDLRTAGGEALKAGDYAYTATTVSLTKDGLCRMLTVVEGGPGTLGDCAAGTALHPYVSAVLLDSPVVYYRLSETSGTSLADSSGNGRSATLSGAVALGAAGLAGDGTSATFGGGVATTPTGAHFQSATASVEAWIRTSQTSGIGNIADRDVEAVGRQFQFRVSSGKLSYIVFVNGSPVELLSTRTVADGAAHHVVGTYDGTTVKVYVDGVLDASLAAAGTYATGGNSVLGLGAHAVDAGSYVHQQYSGVADEVAVYGSALSAERIAAHHAAR